jgi:hypothetical protein
MISIDLLLYYILAILVAILVTILIVIVIILIVKLLRKLVKKSSCSLEQISIVNVLEAILRVVCEVGTDDYITKDLITETSNIIINAKFGYCSKIPNIKYDKKRAVYEKEWLEVWTKQRSNITKTSSVFLQVKHKFYLLSEVEQINDTDKYLIHDALKKIDEWLMSQTDYDISIIVT